MTQKNRATLPKQNFSKKVENRWWCLFTKFGTHSTKSRSMFIDEMRVHNFAFRSVQDQKCWNYERITIWNIFWLDKQRVRNAKNAWSICVWTLYQMKWKKGLHSAQNCFVKIENSIKKGSICCYFLGVIPRYCRVFSQFYSLHQ